MIPYVAFYLPIGELLRGGNEGDKANLGHMNLAADKTATSLRNTPDRPECAV